MRAPGCTLLLYQLSPSTLSTQNTWICARFQFSRQRADHPGIFILKKTSHGGGENEDRLPGVAEDQRLHVAAEFVAVLFVIFAVHVREDCNRTACLQHPPAELVVMHLVYILFARSWRGLIPRCFNFDCRVVRFNPSLAAAPRARRSVHDFPEGRAECARAPRVPECHPSQIPGSNGLNSLRGTTSTDPGQNQRAFDEVFQFADVSGPLPLPAHPWFSWECW